MSRHFVERLVLGENVLTGDTAHHLLHVLRTAPGSEVVLFDTSGNQAIATVKACERDRVVVTIGEVSHIDRESPLSLALVFALSKGEKPEWIAQKAVELGATEIVAFHAARSVVRWKADDVPRKLQRLEAVVKGALEQSGRAKPPALHFAVDLAAAAQSVELYQLKLVVHPEARQSLAACLADAQGKSIALLCGPEGGFTADELHELTQKFGWLTARMGPRILRAETAALAALALVQGMLGDLTT